MTWKVGYIYEITHHDYDDSGILWSVISECIEYKGVGEAAVTLTDVMILCGETDIDIKWILSDVTINDYATYKEIGKKEDHPEYFL